MPQNKVTGSYLVSCVAFLREWLRSPKEVGAVAPSGPALCRCMASYAAASTGPIVELGPGLGQVTEALLNAGIAPSRLMLIEQSDRFVQQLRLQFPDVNVIHGDAQDLVHYCHDKGITSVKTVVSSLPFLALDAALGRSILQAIHDVLDEDGQMIQFTYGLKSPIAPLSDDFTPSEKHAVFLNVPPANVWLFKPRAKQAAQQTASESTVGHTAFSGNEENER